MSTEKNEEETIPQTDATDQQINTGQTDEGIEDTNLTEEELREELGDDDDEIIDDEDDNVDNND